MMTVVMMMVVVVVVLVVVVVVVVVMVMVMVTVMVMVMVRIRKCAHATLVLFPAIARNQETIHNFRKGRHWLSMLATRSDGTPSAGAGCSPRCGAVLDNMANNTTQECA